MLVLSFASDTIQCMNNDIVPSENLSNRILPENNTEPHHHYKRMLIIIAGLLLVVVVIAILWQFVFKGGMKSQEKLRAQYEAEQMNQLQKSFGELVTSNPPKDMTEAEMKAKADFLKNNTSEPMTEAEIKTSADNQRVMQEQGFEAWKASNN